MSQFDNIIFKNKKFSDVLEEIYNNQKKKDQQVTALISELKPLISDIGDATLVVPLIKEYMEISVKNDDILIKMAALAQRAMATVTAEGSLTISDEEKEQLLSAMNELKGEK
jgi:2',3'-cyclic-nucleotide 2'-phosphodiesterase (5'-nucleotidase family)